MTVEPPQTSIQLEEDIGFQRREWRIKRIAWAAFALIILGSILGVFGAGVLSASSASDSQGLLKIEHQRFNRLAVAADMTLTIQPGAIVADQVTIWIDRSFLESISNLQFTPQPRHSVLHGERCHFVFTAGSEETLRVLMQFRPARHGSLRMRAGLPDREGVEVNQFVYP